MNDSVTIVLFATMDDIREKGVNLREGLERFKADPYVHELIKGSELREYESHIIADGGRSKMNQLYTDGVLLCGDAGAIVNDMYTGVPSCMLSGIKAAETVAYARQQRRYDAATLAKYEEILYTTGLPRIMFNARTFSDFMVKSGWKNLGTFDDKLFDFGWEADPRGLQLPRARALPRSPQGLRRLRRALCPKEVAQMDAGADGRRRRQADGLDEEAKIRRAK